MDIRFSHCTFCSNKLLYTKLSETIIIENDYIEKPRMRWFE